MKTLRRIYRLLLISLHTIRCIFYVLAVLSPDPGKRTAKDWQRIMRLMTQLRDILGLHVTVAGRPVQGPALFAANHISWQDIVVLQSLAPTGFIAKEEIRGWPLIGWLAHYGNTLFIRRGKRDSFHQIHMAMIGRLEDGQNFLIFPEGTTTAGDEVKTFKTRLLEPALTMGIPVQPVAIYYSGTDYSCRELAFINHESLMSHLWRVLGEKTIHAVVDFCEPIQVDKHERRDLGRIARAEVVEALAKYRLPAADTSESADATTEINNQENAA